MKSFSAKFRMSAMVKSFSVVLVKEASKAERLPDALEVITLPVGFGRVVLVGRHQRLLELQHGVIFLLLEVHLHKWEVPGGPLLVPPGLRDLFARHDVGELSADVAAEENEPEMEDFCDVRWCNWIWRWNSLAVLREVQLDITTSEGGHQLDLAKAVEQLVRLALEFLFEDDRLAVDLDAQRLVRRGTRRLRMVDDGLVASN